MSGRRAAGAYAVLAVALGYVLSVATNLATSAVPSSWHWAHNGALLWSVVGVLAAAGVAVAIAQFGSSPVKARPNAHVAPWLPARSEQWYWDFSIALTIARL